MLFQFRERQLDSTATGQVAPRRRSTRGAFPSPWEGTLPEMMEDVFVGRQPIYGRDLELFAYELLYRGGDVDFADFTEGDRATSQVLLNTFTEFGIDRVVGRHLAFVNLTRGFITGEYPLPVPREQVVLEVLEDIQPDPEVLAGLRRLRREGFKIALDDFVITRENESLLPLADIVKVDVLALERDGVREQVQALRPYGLKLLAEKIETREQFEECLELGFDYFQGYFLARPFVLRGSSLPASRINLLRLLAEIQDPGTDFDRVNEIVCQDVSLSYKLLRHMNSALYGMPRKFESIRETVVYLGLSTVRNLACLFLLSNVPETPHELIVTSMLRAKMCALLAAAAGLENLNAHFTAGLFSTLDVLMGSPMPAIVERLPLSKELAAALARGEGPLGEALAATIAYERGEWDKVECFGLRRRQIKIAFLDAVAWVEDIDREMRSIAA